MKIGIGITTTSNRDCFKQSFHNIVQYSNADLYSVIEDVKGIAKAKNQCLSELDSCDHIFLFDDDCYPLCNNWHLPYINSGEPHLSFTWRRKEIKRERGLIHYDLPDGQMLYINRKCLDVIGGFDEQYIGYGYEHVDYSVRAFNAGLTSGKFMDVENSSQFLYTLDMDKRVKSSVPDRGKYIPANHRLFLEQANSKEFKSYK